MKKSIKFIIAFMMILNIFILFKVESTYKELKEMKMEFGMDINDIHRRIGYLKNDDKDTDSKDFIDDYEIVAKGQLDLKTYTIPACIRILPKDLRTKDTYKLKYDDNLYTMIKESDDVYKLDIEYNIFDKPIYHVIRERSGFTREEKLYNIYLESDILDPEVVIADIDSFKDSFSARYMFKYERDIDGLIKSVIVNTYINNNEVKNNKIEYVDERMLEININDIKVEDKTIESVLDVKITVEDINGYKYIYNMDKYTLKVDESIKIKDIFEHENHSRFTPYLEKILFKDEVIYEQK